MNTEKRMIGKYEVASSIQIGKREIVLAINETGNVNKRFICTYVSRNDLFENYEECIASNDCVKIVHLYAERIAKEYELLLDEVKKLSFPVTLITKNDCVQDQYSKDINNKIIAIKPESLRPEHQRADRQIHLVIGGFGASANSCGSDVFCKNLHTGHQVRWERSDVMGEIKPECLPKWAKEKLKSLKERNNKTKKDYSLERCNNEPRQKERS